MTVRLDLKTQQACSDACADFSELAQALKMGAVKRIYGTADSIMVIELDVSPNFSRALILAMFAGLEKYFLDRQPLDELVEKVKRGNRQ